MIETKTIWWKIEAFNWNITPVEIFKETAKNIHVKKYGDCIRQVAKQNQYERYFECHQQAIGALKSRARNIISSAESEIKKAKEEIEKLDATEIIQHINPSPH